MSGKFAETLFKFAEGSVTGTAGFDAHPVRNRMDIAAVTLTQLSFFLRLIFISEEPGRRRSKLHQPLQRRL